MKRWFVVHTHAQGEVKAEHHLARQGFETYLPCYLKRRSHARRVDFTRAPLFPRYLFVRLDPERERWRSILSTTGVARMIMNGDQPAELPHAVIDEIRARADADGLVALDEVARFRPGDEVEVLDGAFSQYRGIFEAIDDRERVTILLDLFGRKTRVRLPFEAVRASA